MLGKYLEKALLPERVSEFGSVEGEMNVAYWPRNDACNLKPHVLGQFCSVYQYFSA